MRPIKHLFSIIVLMAACKSSKEYYQPSEILPIAHFQDSTGNNVVYSIPLETLFYSSGCDISFNNDSSEAKLWFIKQKINTPFRGGIKSKIYDQKGSLSYVIVIPGKTRK